MNVKKIAPFAIALVLGLISAELVVKQFSKPAPKPMSAAPPNAKVVIVKQDLMAGEQLTTDEVDTNELTTPTAPPGSFHDETDVVGRVTAAPLVAGQTITESLLAQQGSVPGLQAVIPPGMRAVTIEVNEVSGVANYVVPGCHVDLVQTFNDSANQPFSRMLIQNVEVTAVGMRRLPGDGPSTPRSVTLLVTPRQSEEIDLAESNGRARLALRGVGDRDTNSIAGVSLTELTGGRGFFNSPTSVAPRPTATPTNQPAAPTTKPSAPEQHLYEVRVITGQQQDLVAVQPPKANPTTPVSRTDQDEQP
jgi:pilus assembly protein CpaB